MHLAHRFLPALLFFTLCATSHAPRVQAAENGFLAESVPAYGIRQSLQFARNYAALDLHDPDTLSLYTAPPSSNVWSGTFVDDDFSKQYIVGEDAALRTVSTVDGTVTYIGALPPPVAADYWLGLSWDPAGKQLYGGTCSHTVGQGCRLYAIDLDTLALTLVGDIGGSDMADFFLMDMAFDSTGRLYAITLNDAYPVWLIEIDTQTAAVTPIGPTGVPAQYAQGMDFDKRTDTLYWAAFGGLGENGAYGGKVYTVDTLSGAVTEVGLTPGGGEVWALSIATAAPAVFCDGFEETTDAACP